MKRTPFYLLTLLILLTILTGCRVSQIPDNVSTTSNGMVNGTSKGAMQEFSEETKSRPNFEVDGMPENKNRDRQISGQPFATGTGMIGKQ